MFKFWYEFIPKAYSVIELGQGDLYYEKIVRPALHSFMGSVFEDMCRHYTLEMGVRNEFDSFITNVGTWWGVETVIDDKGERKGQSTDIDVVGISEIDKTAVVGECKFKNEKIDKPIYETIQRRANLISGKYRVKTILLFSLSGYTDWVIENRGADTKLITLEELYK